MLEVRPLPEDLQKIATEELNEVPERLAKDISALKEWIEKQPYLKARTNDQFLISFLRGCKFSLEKAKSKIDKYYTLKSQYPDFFTIQNPDNPKVLELIKMGIGVALPRPLNDNGPRIMLIRPGVYPTERFSFNDVMCIANSMQEIQMFEDDYANVHGIIDILDMSTCTAAHFFQMTPNVVKKMSTFAEEAVPIRQKGTHFINTPAGFEQFFNMLKPFMPQKQKERLFVHGSKMEDLYNHIPKEYLPIEYGGKNGSIEEIISLTVAKFLEYRDYYLEDKEYKTNEKLRPGKPVDYESIFGVDGSFRKLNID